MHTVKNIAIDARMISKSGIGAYIRNILGGVKYDFAVGSRGDLPASFPDDRVIRFEYPNYSIKEQLFFPYKHLRRAKIDVLHVPHLNIPIFYRGKMAVTIHDLTHLRFPQFLPGKFHHFYFKFMLRLACKKAAGILTVSENTKRDIMEFFNVDPGKIFVTPLAAGEEFVHKDRGTVAYLQKKYSIPADKKIILYVGNLLPHKNLSALLKAFELLKERDECRVVIVGKVFKERLNLDCPTSVKKSIICTGFVTTEELVDFYNLADVFVLPSLYEGFGLPVLEAMACGTPVACSQTSSLPETGGHLAFYFDPTDAQNIAEQISYALDSKQSPQDLRGYARQFSWKRTTEQTIAAINKICEM
jgi:glycosyltransferase involved in cell wall biosynthesis